MSYPLELFGSSPQLDVVHEEGRVVLDAVTHGTSKAKQWESLGLLHDLLLATRTGRSPSASSKQNDEIRAVGAALDSANGIAGTTASMANSAA
jgi:hypothetical protein